MRFLIFQYLTKADGIENDGKKTLTLNEHKSRLDNLELRYSKLFASLPCHSKSKHLPRLVQNCEKCKANLDKDLKSGQSQRREDGKL